VEVLIRQAEILELKTEYLTGAQAIEQHEGNDGEIAKGAKATPETVDLVDGERNDASATWISPMPCSIALRKSSFICSRKRNTPRLFHRSSEYSHPRNL
jgi:hypothetical protein